MARNRVQTQKGLSEAEFAARYGSEEQCRAAVIAARWPEGFTCPICGGKEHSVIQTRGLFQCSACRRQTSPMAGTIFASTHLALTVWFRALYHLTQSKNAISSVELGRRLGIKQSTAWKLKHKLQQVMLDRDGASKLGCRVELDDAYLGGERRGGKRGRGAEGKTPFLAAVETTLDGRPHRIKLCRVEGFTKAAITQFAQRRLLSGCHVVSDGLGCFTAVTQAGCHHQPIPTGSGPAAVEKIAFKWVNTVLGNVKSAITGTYRSIGSEHVPRYLAEFQYRFNRRYDLGAMVNCLLKDSIATPPMPYRLLKLAEPWG